MKSHIHKTIKILAFLHLYFRELFHSSFSHTYNLLPLGSHFELYYIFSSVLSGDTEIFKSA